MRVGNGAVDQLQLDVYGELIDSVYLFDKHGRGISHDAWSDLRRIVAWLMDNWERPDAGMWELRTRARVITLRFGRCFAGSRKATAVLWRLPPEMVSW